MTRPPFPVLYEDNHLLVINKPNGLPTQGALPGVPSVVELAKDYLAKKYNKSGNVYLGVVSRLDRLVSGVLVLARTSKAAARLTQQFREQATGKEYWAVVEKMPPKQRDTLVDWVIKDDTAHRMRIIPAHSPDAQRAELAYAVMKRLPSASLVEVVLKTGRKHQIRLQLAAVGCPIVNDTKYGAQASAFFHSQEAIALHARSLSIEHPTLKTALRWTAPLPPAWAKLGVNEE
jgi:23S rRNA pseudouridine1911/1915/1917 synthase